MRQRVEVRREGSTNEPPAAPRQGSLALRLLRCSPLSVIRKHGTLPPLAPSAYRRQGQGSDGTVGAEPREIR